VWIGEHRHTPISGLWRACFRITSSPWCFLGNWSWDFNDCFPGCSLRFFHVTEWPPGIRCQPGSHFQSLPWLLCCVQSRVGPLREPYAYPVHLSLCRDRHRGQRYPISGESPALNALRKGHSPSPAPPTLEKKAPRPIFMPWTPPKLPTDHSRPWSTPWKNRPRGVYRGGSTRLEKVEGLFSCGVIASEKGRYHFCLGRPGGDTPCLFGRRSFMSGVYPPSPVFDALECAAISTAVN
jgi:hypothetical protein